MVEGGRCQEGNLNFKENKWERKVAPCAYALEEPKFAKRNSNELGNNKLLESCKGECQRENKKSRPMELDRGPTPFKNGTLHNPFGPNFGQLDYNTSTLQNFNIK